jgi:hypothetical protein
MHSEVKWDIFTTFVYQEDENSNTGRPPCRMPDMVSRLKEVGHAEFHSVRED